jgi:hypothetical protein
MSSALVKALVCYALLRADLTSEKDYAQRFLNERKREKKEMSLPLGRGVGRVRSWGLTTNQDRARRGLILEDVEGRLERPTGMGDIPCDQRISLLPTGSESV